MTRVLIELPQNREGHVLLYSAEADDKCGHNFATMPDGSEVKYTAMVNEKEHGPWQHNYGWPDARVVGFLPLGGKTRCGTHSTHHLRPRHACV